MKIEINLDFLNHLTPEQWVWCGIGLWYFLAWIFIVFILQVMDTEAPLQCRQTWTIIDRLSMFIFSPLILAFYFIIYTIKFLFGFRSK